ncbi:MAG: hypothetical protein A2007_04595 [Verrucomicrobia bacterium GWC2_42_7]|nr:MAG: hypothetical protein A2007_04595 [Verrucomicrobia bacterium GWC2_42_7]
MQNNNHNNTLTFVAVTVNNRKQTSNSLNNVLSEFGDNIISRSGMFYQKNNSWIVTLIVESNDTTAQNLLDALNHIQGVHVQTTSCCHATSNSSKSSNHSNSCCCSSHDSK